MKDLKIALGMLAGAAVPGVALYFVTGGAMWAAVLSGFLAVPFGIVGGFVVLALAGSGETGGEGQTDQGGDPGGSPVVKALGA